MLQWMRVPCPDIHIPHPTTLRECHRFKDEERVRDAVKHALRIGYRHLDCAALYGNEQAVGEAIKASVDDGAVRRNEVYVASKLWNNRHRPHLVEDACAQSMADLGVDHLDCYMMHWPCPWTPESALVSKELGGNFKYEHDMEVKLEDTWKAMEQLYLDKKVRHIGVSNFSIRQLQELMDVASIKPAVNEVELHPYHQNTNLVKFCQNNGIHVTAYSPLGKIGYRNPGDPCLIDDPVLQDVAKRHANKTPAQVALKWNVQRGVGVIPKSLTPSRIESNFNLDDFSLTERDMQEIAKLNRNHRFVRPPWWSFPDDKHELP
ncbi:2,5-didehydrogluconate reductase [Salpingoeca rosetta]|uniref:2,5-didehydrogluconate reductase n=1 Tax=Salpingoeca rosetta (strain ATCC 50818 / BSB-021) TaxID=946362 RepID=F2UFE8_SALR5|nr:2,5-didehydrogluconate reductase [Salpingoeca rosetta]EGD75516.1 2,5-didehydrogluconate reductase [Salpingoeca rosetta]|eukprot:XP_004991973.1 2,5-didehydrogluconate reductase [Salpingoeca rosetta]